MSFTGNPAVSRMVLKREYLDLLQDDLAQYFNTRQEFKFWSKQKKSLKEHPEQENPDDEMKSMENISGRLDMLQQKKTDWRRTLYSKIKIILSEDPEYKPIYIQYMDCIASNDDDMNVYGHQLNLLHKAGEVEALFDEISNLINENRELSKAEEAAYSQKYKKHTDFLENCYYNIHLEYAEDLKSSELNWEDPYATLMKMSLFKSKLIKPMQTTYGERYESFLKRAEFIKDFNDRVHELLLMADKDFQSRHHG